MASNVNRRTVSVEDFFLLSGRFHRTAVDLCLWNCAAFFMLGLQPRGYTKQLMRVQAGRAVPPNADVRIEEKKVWSLFGVYISDKDSRALFLPGHAPCG